MLTALGACSLAGLPQIAQFAAELERYPQAIGIYESVARGCVDNNLLKYRCLLFVLPPCVR